MTMNIEVFTLASEETLISLAVFSGAFFFLIYQKITSLKKQIIYFEESEISSRDSLQRDMNRVNTVIEDLKYEYVDTEKNIERQLVELEMGNLTLQPKIKEFYKTMSNNSEKFYKVLEKIERELHTMTKNMSTADSKDLAKPLSLVNETISTLVNQMETISHKCVDQSRLINELSNDISLIKRGHGIE